MGKYHYDFEWVIFIASIVLLLLGLVTLLSIGSNYFYDQLVMSIISIVLFFILQRADFSLYYYLDRIIYIGCIIFLALTFFGPTVRGATRWIEINSFRIQPSELIKPWLLICFASFFVRYPPTKIRNLFFLVGAYLLPVFIVFKQPDLGTAIVYTAFFLSMLLVSNMSHVILIIGSILVTIITPFGFSLLQDYQKQRIMTFLNPVLDPYGSGYNALQSMITVGSGQLSGRGFGRGTQSLLQFLPEYHTDFIFASYIEIFGFVGGIVMLVIFFIFLWRFLMLISKQIPQTLGFYYMIGLFTLLFTQIGINIGMNMGIIPVTGITLPLISYGRSSLLSVWISLSLLFSAIRGHKRQRASL